ncbi:hypothetical protein BDA99DRAFT_198434 [Phascolomyces articulosus]|uniref:Uncharacterized protein n=1 Tax=Phascolomyces articulosus TaxID=60185 RepID=A0AAD5KA34_9FUNG|nr:hypothetical protein BDA99DRAFT_198434 [Phascolomyces articulosus]
MSNVLQFKSFHDRHFNPEQVKHWQQFILNQQQQQQQEQPDLSQWQQYNESNAYWSNQENNGDYSANQETYTQGVTNEYMEQEQEPYYEEEEGQPGGLSKEAIEIFKFSEAYRKERKFFDSEKYYVCLLIYCFL